MGYTPRKTVSRLAREQLHFGIKQSFEGQSFPILINGSRVWSISHLYYDAVFTDRERQDKMYSLYRGKLCAGTVKIYYSLKRRFRYSGVHCSGVCFHIFYCNSAGLSYVVHYSGVLVIAGCHYIKLVIF